MSKICWSQSVSLDEETIQQVCSNPDPETAFNVMVRRRRAEVKVVEATSRQGISPSALMKIRWVVTFKVDGSLRARLVVEGFTDQRLGKIPTSSPTASRRSRQIFLTLAASLGFQTHRGDVTCAFLQGDLDEQRVDDDDDDNFKIESAQPVSDTSCEPVPELPRKLQVEHHQCIRLLKAVYGLVNTPRRWYHRVATDLRNLTGEESVMVPCLWTFRDENAVSFMPCAWFTSMISCWRAVTPFGKNVFESINKLYEW